MRLGRTAPAVATGLAAAVAVGIVASLDPSEAGHYPTCPFLALTGLQCPGCGALRAIHALAHGDAATGFGFNLLVPLIIPLLVWAWIGWLRSGWRGEPRAPTLPASAAYGLVAVASVFWVLRNLPWFAPLAA